jgi:hypothetical protein
MEKASCLVRSLISTVLCWAFSYRAKIYVMLIDWEAGMELRVPDNGHVAGKYVVV